MPKRRNLQARERREPRSEELDKMCSSQTEFRFHGERNCAGGEGKYGGYRRFWLLVSYLPHRAVYLHHVIALVPVRLTPSTS
jgi:hypothetical protein